MNTRENWRKLLSLFLVLTMCLATLPLSAFAEEDCAHEWGEWETSKEPTCSEEGEQTRTCSLCGDTETEALEKLEHTPEDVNEVPAQVGVPGKTAGVVCAVCKEVLEGCEVIEALEETEDEPVLMTKAKVAPMLQGTGDLLNTENITFGNYYTTIESVEISEESPYWIRRRMILPMLCQKNPSTPSSGRKTRAGGKFASKSFRDG